MYGIEVLMEEHKNILKFTDKMEDICIEILNGKDVDIDVFRKAIIFVREYADGHHHEKEEDLIFKFMLSGLGDTADALVRNGMMVEHDLARLHILELEKALNEYEEGSNDKAKLAIVTNTMSYVYLLRRHIDKEDRVVYPYAKSNLSKDDLNEIDSKTREMEDVANQDDNLSKYLEFINR